MLSWTNAEKNAWVMDAAGVAEVRHNAGEEAAGGEDCEKTGARRAEEDERVVAVAPVE